MVDFLDNNRGVAILAVPVVASIREILVYLYAKVNQQDPFPEKQTTTD